MDPFGSSHGPPCSLRSGFTLLELTVVLMLMGMVTLAAAPAARRQADRWAVAGAREAVVGLFVRARSEAAARGGARVFLAAEPAQAWVEAGGVVLGTVELAERWGVRLRLSRDRPRARLLFDGLGIGRAASQSLVFSRGGARVLLVVSSYGRVSRR